MSGKNPARWSATQRLEFVADRLFWDGTLQREDLISRFGVSPAQATADIARLRQRLGAGIAYDPSRRAYAPMGQTSEPPTSATRLLAEMRLIGERMIGSAAGVLAHPPPIEVIAVLTRAVEPETLRQVIWAIRDRRALEASYVSFQRPEVTQRLLSPHALVFEGFRWHARARDASDGGFKDFLLSRLSEPRLCGDAIAGAEYDTAWHTHRLLRIVPHPGLTEHQKRVVMLDYGMKDGKLDLNVREAVVFYVKRRFGLDEGHERRPACEQHIIMAAEF